jgi:class 3 adenylate cyclase
MGIDQLHEDIVTVMFTDVEGFTDMTNRRGDTAAQRVIDAERKLVREQVAHHGGREIDQIGDGFMVAFTSTRRAIACALAIQESVARHNRDHVEEGLRIRVGLNVGEVIEEGGHPFGAAVNGASRVAGKARGGEILVSEAVKQLAGTIPEVSFRDRGRFELKGFPDRWRLYQVVASDGDSAKASRGAFASRTIRARRPAGARLALAVGGVGLAVAAIGVGFVLLRGGNGGGQPSSPETSNEGTAIVVGRSIGRASLGMTEAEAQEAYGSPEASRTWTSRGRSGSTVTFSTPGGTLAISFFDGQAVQITTRSRRYRTDGGIKVGLDRVPNPGISPPFPGSDWRDALASGELIQTGPNRYVWRGFAFGGQADYCASGEGAVTMLILKGTKIDEIRIVRREFVRDQLPLGAATTATPRAPCVSVGS